MPQPAIPTLTGQIPKDAVDSFNILRGYTAQVEAALQELANRPVPALTAAQLKQASTALSAIGPAPLNLTGLGGASSTGVGTHAQRLVANPTTGALFYETDRQVLYVGSAGVWLYGASFPGIGTYVTEALLPGDLTTNDQGFPAWGSDTGLLYVWSGAVWHKRAGVMRGTFAARPVAFVGTDAGLIYVATDRGGQAWILDFATSLWVLLRGWGSAMQGTLSPDQKPALTVNDVGFRFWSTDFRREYTWDGAAWGDSPGQDLRLVLIGMFTADPGAGWVPLDGGTYTRSTATGGTTSTGVTANYTVPDTYLRAGSSFGTLGTFGAVGTTYQFGSVRLFQRV